MKSILVIHQSAELYGSDKTMLMFLSHLDKKQYYPVIILPGEGPLKTELEKAGIEVVIAPVLKVHRKMFTLSNMALFAKQYKESLKIVEDLHAKYNFKLVYSHTLAVMVGLLFARRHNIKHLWHVQEIIARPKIFRNVFRKMLELKSNDVAVYDSKETMHFWATTDKLKKKSVAIWNGIDTEAKPHYPHEEIQAVREQFFAAGNDEVVIGLVGRINSWKGQQLLLEAFNILKDDTGIKLVFVGSAPPNQDFFLTALEDKIRHFGLNDRVVIVPFQEGIWKFWDAIDIAVVPSTEPEPFGMVAIEAMTAKKPVIAANHGGLTEILLHGETGYLFEPGNAQALAGYLKELAGSKETREAMAAKGYKRVQEVFSLKGHVQKFEEIFNTLTGK